MIAPHGAATQTPQGIGLFAPLPRFVPGFFAMVIVDSVVTVPAALKGWIAVATVFMLSMALAASAWIFIAVFGLVLVGLTGYA